MLVHVIFHLLKTSTSSMLHHGQGYNHIMFLDEPLGTWLAVQTFS